MNAGQISNVVQEVQGLGDEVLATLKVVDPAVAVPAEVAETVLNLLGKMVSSAIDAFAHAAGTPITVTSIEALRPDATPLTPPPATTPPA